jgi:poly(3-hydroxyalkanoate) synthetase
MLDQLGIFSLPFVWTQEMMRFSQDQLRRQIRFLEYTVLKPPAEAKWSTPNTIALNLPSLQLRDFTQGEASDESVPTLLINPQVNSSYICDYGKGQSLIATLRQEGLRRIYAVDWKSATLDRADETLDDALWALHRVIDHLGGRVRLIGLCQGGWMSLILSALFPEKIQSVTLAAAPVDFHVSPGVVNILARYVYPMAFYEGLVAMGGGIMRGDFISMGFNNLRPVERYIVKYLDLYAHLDDEAYLERYQALDNWYSLAQHIPGATYLRIVKELFKENLLVQGKLLCCGQVVNLQKTRCPVVLIAGSKDHITLPEQLFATQKYVASQEIHRFTTDAGHVGVFMGSRTLKETWPQVVKILLDIARREEQLPARPSQPTELCA